MSLIIQVLQFKHQIQMRKQLYFEFQTIILINFPPELQDREFLDCLILQRRPWFLSCSFIERAFQNVSLDEVFCYRFLLLKNPRNYLHFLAWQLKTKFLFLSISKCFQAYPSVFHFLFFFFFPSSLSSFLPFPSSLPPFSLFFTHKSLHFIVLLSYLFIMIKNIV